MAKEKSPFNKAFWEIVEKYKRKNPGTTNESLAEALDVSTGILSEYCNGNNSNPSLEKLKKFHDFFNVSFAYLAGETPFSDNDSAKLFESEIAMTKINAMGYGKSHVVDSTIDSLRRLSNTPAYVSIGTNHSLSKMLDTGGDNIRGEKLVICSIDAAGDIMRALVNARDNAFNLTTQQVNALQLANPETIKKPNSKHNLSDLIGKIAMTRNIYSDLDIAIAEFKKKMDVAIVSETERLNNLYEEWKEGEDNGNNN